MKRIIIYSVLIFLSACVDVVNGSKIPNVHFRYSVDLYQDQFLRAPGNYRIYPNIGYKGLIVYNLDGNIFYAYDLACTYKDGIHEISTGTKGSEPIIECKHCGSIFNLINAGAPVEAPATYPLKQYTCSKSNMSVWITN
ncbi:hypothetical protein K4L44_12325 [Halosquirtibacter laminarini]|uniref:Uncharacterized protein n=1 Tax=Halosquirtibacter laminarini TaxID=3374600 RepID=A0AC61NCX4_9BACT|nr:hypothetical protein K4L44_12325 [Prolixibacteraceae bacterium]